MDLSRIPPQQENISWPVGLEAGRRYYLQALMKEDRGRDHLGVAWQLPGEPPPANFSPPIPGTYLTVLFDWARKAPAALISSWKNPGQP